MKFKPIYLYAFIALVSVIILIIVASQNSDEQTNVSSELNQNIPNDDVHKNLMKQGSNQPSKENVSEEYRNKMAELKAEVEKNPDDTLALKKYADFLSAAHNMNDAITYYEKILKVNPKRVDIRFALAVIYYHKQDYAKCEDENKQVLTFQGLTPEGLSDKTG